MNPNLSTDGRKRFVGGYREHQSEIEIGYMEWRIFGAVFARLARESPADSPANCQRIA